MGPTHGGNIIILGTHRLQNQLLERVLRSELGVDCTSVSMETTPPGPAGTGSGNTLMLIDAKEYSFDDVSGLIIQDRQAGGDGRLYSLFDMEKDTGIESQALQRGIRGFFYLDDKVDLILKGIAVVFAGEVWLPRSILTEIALSREKPDGETARRLAGLTRREVEILTLVSLGSTNDAIADKLFISRHTVKTHLYNIFRKIHVSNRFQAALWAAKNL